MTTTTIPAPSKVSGRLSAVGVIRSEWIKLRTVRSTLWCYGVLVVLIVGVGLLVPALTDRAPGTITGDEAGPIAVFSATTGLNFAVLIAAVLGSLIITGEYRTGMIRSTFAAVPRRTGALAAKAIVLAATTFVATSIGIWVAALISVPILEGKRVEVDLADPAIVMPLLGGGLYVTMVALLAFGFGTILRSTAGSLATVLGLMLIAPVVFQLINQLTDADWAANVASLLPPNAGRLLFTYASDGGSATAESGVWTFDGWSGFAVLAAWNLVVFLVAWILVKRRNA